MGDGAMGVLVHAGILETDEKLTQRAKDLFIEDIKKELTLGSDGFAPIFPCGPKIEPNPHAYLLDLEDEKKFPDFHAQILKGQYEKIAGILNLAGGFMILPICDPLALAFAMGIDVDLNISFPDGFLEYLIPNLPKLAVDLNLMPPIKLAAKFPGLLTLPPKLPVDFTIPPIPKPAFAFDPGLNIDLLFPLKIPSVLLKLIAQLPSLILDLPNLPGAVCNLVFKAGLFNVLPTATVKIVAYKVLVRKISEMLMILAVGKVVGSSPIGVTGGLGTKLGYQPPLVESTKKRNSPRDKIAQYAEDCVDLAWGNTSKTDDGTIQEQYVQRLLYTEYGDGARRDNLNIDDPLYDPRVIGKKKSIEKAATLSSCGMLARAACMAGGASYVFRYAGQPQLNKNQKLGRFYDFFTDEYRLIGGQGIAISGLIQAAKSKNATIPKQKNDLPPVKRGDVIVVYDPKVSNREHVMVIVEDYEPGSFELITVEGGQTDSKNNDQPTAIKKKIYKDVNSQEFRNKANVLDPPYGFSVTHNGVVKFSGREILTIIDGEKLCTNKTGSDTTNPIKIIDHDIFDLNDPAADAAAGLIPVEG
jgi:hypothetical protein